VIVTVWSLSIGGQVSTPLEVMSALGELTLQTGVTEEVDPSLQLAVAVYVAVLLSFTEGGPSMVRPVRVAAISPPPSPPPPPPPHVKRIIARKTKSNEADKYVMDNFLISTYLLPAFLIGKDGR
jgi:hypothetical protein